MTKFVFRVPFRLMTTMVVLYALNISTPAFAQSKCDEHLGLIQDVADSILNHPYEKRGFVSVPLDYKNPTTSPEIKIFYRLLPALGSSVDDTSKPIMVIINGGPGFSSEHMRSLNFDYSKAAEDKGRLKELQKNYRVLMFDQRGTAGGSAPLNMNDPKLDPYFVAEYFNAPHMANDLGAIINTVVPKGEQFYIIAQSFGGMVGVIYMTETKKSPAKFQLPTGIVFAASSLPTRGDPVEWILGRRKEQYNINLKLAAKIPEIKGRILQLRERIRSVRPDSTFVDMLYGELVGNMTGEWEAKLNKKIEGYLAMTDAQLQSEIDKNTDNISMLNYILSSTVLTPGYTDKSLSRLVIQKFPFEPWMIDENAYYRDVRGDTADQDRIIAQIDKTPPTPVQFPSAEEIRKALEQTKVLFTTAEDDAAVPMSGYIQAVKKLQPSTGKIIVLPNGGHSAVFQAPGVKALSDNGFL